MEKLPSSEQLGNELARVRYRISFHNAVKSTIYALITVAAVAVLVAVFSHACFTDLRFFDDPDGR